MKSHGAAFQAPEGFPAEGCGMAASLCGGTDDPRILARLKLLYGVTYALEGVPLLYIGDEIALENFEGFRDDPALKDEIHWLHRPEMDWTRAARRHDAKTVEGGIYRYLQGLSPTLSGIAFLPGQDTRDTGNPGTIPYGTWPATISVSCSRTWRSLPPRFVSWSEAASG
jgi:amylosucrase